MAMYAHPIGTLITLTIKLVSAGRRNAKPYCSSKCSSVILEGVGTYTGFGSRVHKKIGNYFCVSKGQIGSEGPKAVTTIHVTGFKKFQGINENPTEKIVNNLKDFIEKGVLIPGVTLGSCNVLEAAGAGALTLLCQTLESGISRTTSNGQVVWLHLGVDAEARKFAIEKQAVNEATFSYPDELGWQPKQIPIVSEDGGISRARETSCCIEDIIKFLKNRGFDATISDDAGRFVCNYVYYHSLRHAEQKGHKSLFVHVPPFSRIDEETQMNFVAILLQAIASST